MSVFYKISVALFCSSALVAQSPETYDWNTVSMGGGGFVSGIVTSSVEQNLMYARTDVGGAYKWDVVNSKWMPLLDWNSEDETGFQGVEALAIDPQATNKLYMLVGTSYFNSGKTAILRSSDYGQTFAMTDVSAQFKAHGNGMGRQNGEKLVVDPNNSSILFCGTRANGLFKSSNAGVDWSALTSFAIPTTPNANGIAFVLMDPASSAKGNATQTLYVAVSKTGTNFYVSTDGGNSFNAVVGAPTAYMPQRAVRASDGTLYLTYADKEGPNNPATGQIWKYVPLTNTWTNITPSGFSKPFSGISIDPNNANKIIVSTINVYMAQYVDNNSSTVWGDRILLSSDGGTSWKDLVGNSGIALDANGCTWINQNSIHWCGSIEFNPFNSNQAFVTSGNGIFSCDDLSAVKTTWKFNIKGLEETVALDAVSIEGGPFVSVIGDYDGFTHSDVTQYAPIHNPRTGSTTGLAFGGSVLLRSGNNMYYSFNNGATWTQCTTKGAKGKVAVSADGKTFVHCPEGSSTTYYSTDKGGTWTACSGLSFSNVVPIADAVNPTKFYAYENTGGAFYKSSDGGKTFSTTLNLNTWGSRVFRAVPGMEGDLWYAAGWDGLKRSVNSGTSFSKLNSVTYAYAVGFGKAAVGKTFPAIYIWGVIGGVKGVYRSIDEGATWLRVNDDQHEYGGPGNGQFVMGDMNVYGRVYMSTVGRGIAYGESVLTTGIEEITLENNNVRCYPNPFSETFVVQVKGVFSYMLSDLNGNTIENGEGESSAVIGQNCTSGLFILNVKTKEANDFVKLVKK